MLHFVYFKGKRFNWAGRGSVVGAQKFVCPADGEVIDKWPAQVFDVRPFFALARLTGTSGSGGVVRVDHAAIGGGAQLAVGMELLVGPLVNEAAGPRALAATIIANGRTQPIVERRAVVHEVLGDAAYLRPVEGGPDVFVTVSRCHGFVPTKGEAVLYVPGPQSSRGPLAQSVRLA
ncbi:MAG: hypothetical protein HYS13_08925 [Planctomycetia bacterium]|nr:hypothetical protein [Planctomycetia bacterium]